ncbi:hypothetical protein ACHQM5_015788 [Ranunculus cassubicifolius]
MSIRFSMFFFSSIFLYCCTANLLSKETDRLALIAFRSQILDPQNILSSWNESLHYCEWRGITCGRKHQRVTALNLDSKGLVGPISPHIGNLSFIKVLNLSNNSFQGQLPPELGHLFRLVELRLSRNSLVGEIPVNITLCSNLKQLSLSYNNFIGKIPLELGALSNIMTLHLGANNLSGEIPPSLGNLTSLQVLDLVRNNLEGSIPSILDRLPNLKKLGLGENKLSGHFPISLYNHSTLKIISIPVNQLSGNLPTAIGLMLPAIQTIFIGENQFSGPIPASLYNASMLLALDMSRNLFYGDVPPGIGKLKELQLLKLDENSLGTGKSGDLEFFSSVANCSNLLIFGISYNQFGGMLPASTANFSRHLMNMFLNDNQIFGNIPMGIENLQSLTLLNMGNNSLTGNIPMAIGNLQQLEVLYLNGNHLSGQIPPSIRNMSRLFSLKLSNNTLEGSIGPSLGNQVLQTLDLSHNNFAGSIPNQELDLSSGLIHLTLAHNSLDGSIPLEVGDLKSLEYMDVSENKMSGEIPLTLGGCSSLEYLYLQGNFFQGPIPSSLASLKGLEDVDLSRNNISGEIPKDLEKLSFLKLLNLSFNKIEGEVPKDGVFTNASWFFIFGNPKICGGIPELRLPKCPISSPKKKGTHFVLKITLGILIPSLAITFFSVLYLRRESKTKTTSEPVLGDLKKISYYDLHKATNGFDSTNLIGTGSCGSVYKGTLKQYKYIIAVKVFNLMETGAFKNFIAECNALREVRHRNLLKILTVCSSIDRSGMEFKALVFEFMPNGSLESLLHQIPNGQHKPRSLAVHQRLNIAIDIASALDYLHNHCERPIVHCDLKPSNVLLSDDMTACVGDLGLAKFIYKHNSSREPTNSLTNSVVIRGTIGYIPPEYGMGTEVSKEGDVYSYGIVLLELVTGKRPTDPMFKDGVNLHDYSKQAISQEVIDIADMTMISETSLEDSGKTENLIRSLVKTGVACSAEVVNERIDIETVLKELHIIREAFLRYEPM